MSAASLSEPHWMRESWLPNTHRPIEVLDELRTEHRALLTVLAERKRALSDVEYRFAAEDRELRSRAIHAARTGEPAGDMVATPALQREMELQVARERVDAAVLDLCAFVDRALGVFRQRSAELVATMPSGATNDYKARQCRRYCADWSEISALRHRVVDQPWNTSTVVERVRGEIMERAAAVIA